MNNCLCNIFDDKCVWLIIALLIIFSCNNNNGCGSTYGNNGCGCGC